jgi:hypothetical protein
MKLLPKWMAMYSEDFNTVKHDYRKLNDTKDYEASFDPGPSIFANPLSICPWIIKGTL